jgi:hypothetical protein
MNENQLQNMLGHDTGHTTEPPLRDDFVATSLDLARRRASRGSRTRVVAAGVAVLAAAAITVGVVGGNGPNGDAHSHGGGRGQHESAATAPGAPQALLGRVSLAADEQTVTVRDDQFVYTDVLDDYTAKGPLKGKPVLPPEHYKSWVSVDGSRPGKVVGPGKNATLPVTGSPASLDTPNYRFLETLPTDPAKLVAVLRTQRGMYKQSVSDDDALWRSLSALLNNSPVMPPKLAATIYQVAAKVPGITVVNDATDAAGRHGIAVSRTSGFDGSQITWIFDPKSYQYLGERQDSVNDADATAVVLRGVVDQVGQLPNS